MRYSDAERFPIKQLREHASAEELFSAIAKKTKAEDRRGGVLLVGGVSPRDLAVRNAQAELRLDKLPSYWSHAALILDWKDGAKLDDVVGAEVTLDPSSPTKRFPSETGSRCFAWSATPTASDTPTSPSARSAVRKRDSKIASKTRR